MDFEKVRENNKENQQKREKIQKNLDLEKVHEKKTENFKKIGKFQENCRNLETFHATKA